MKTVKRIAMKYGKCIASLAVLFGIIAANSSCCFPYYEPEEPAGLEKYKKFNK